LVLPALNCCDGIIAYITRAPGEAVINNVIEKAMPVIKEVLDTLGYELVDVEYKTLYGDKHLIVYIASEHGVSLDDCEKVSNALDAPLDALDPTVDAPYCLDVSSPGLDRPFKSQRDYERNYGSDDSGVTLEIDGQNKVFANSAVALVRPYVEF